MTQGEGRILPGGSRALLVVNPVAGRRDAEKAVPKIEEALGELELACEIRRMKAGGEAARWAAEAADSGFGLLVAAGGDGTLAEAAGGLARSGTSLPLLVVPRGTANMVSRVMGIPLNVRDAVGLLRRGVVRRFDIGYLPHWDRFFLLTVAVGFPAESVEEAPRSLKDKLGMGAYLWGAFRNLWKPGTAHFQFVVDGEKREATGHSVLVNNMSRVRALGLELAPLISPDDGKLDVYVGEGESPVEFLGGILEFLAGEGDGRNVSHFPARRVKITAEPTLRVQADGEVLGDTPVEIEIREKAVSLVVPAAYAQDIESP